jgi:antitoxin VapB
MGMNIKNKEAHRLTEELSKLTGESLTMAVTESVRERLNRLRRESGGNLAQRLMAIGKDCAAHLKKPFRTIDHGKMLYDEKGLPK